MTAAGQRIELASDEVTGPAAARILSKVLGRPLAGIGFHADIRQLRTRYPDIGWHSLQQRAATRDWPDLA